MFVQDSGDELFFETISFAPIDLRAIEASLLTVNEKTWLNTYHRNVLEILKSHISEDVAVWLAQKTEAI